MLVDRTERTRLWGVLNRPVIVLSDLHLGPTCPPEASAAAARVLARHPEHELFLMGDTFDLSIDPPRMDPAVSVLGHLRNNPELSRALRNRLERGVSVVFFAGNHDAQLAQPHVRGEILASWGLAESAPLTCGIWCARRADVHFEHGHIYDPDNAPTHPLVPPTYKTEPLGVTLMRRVLAPESALYFAHAHELTPLKGLGQAFVKLGIRAPGLISRYYVEAARIFVKAKPNSFSEELSRGDHELLAFAQRNDFDAESLQQLLHSRAVPRHHLRKAVFGRLYLDRSIATAAWWSSSLFGLVTLQPAFWAISGLGLAYLGVSLSRGKNRYAGSLLDRMRTAANAAAVLVGARAVVFGHTHVEESHRGYVNTGSFAFGGAAGRGYLILDSSGTLLRAHADSDKPPQKLDVLLPTRPEPPAQSSANSMVA